MIEIDKVKIGEDYPPYIIAELSANHNGSLDKAKETILSAKQNGANAVKIQTYTADSMTLDCNKDDFFIKEGTWKGYKLYDLYKWAETPYDWHEKLFKYANRYNIKIIGIASNANSILLKASDIKILIPKVQEADPTGMVPTSSTSITLLIGDCLAVALMNKIKFSKERFKVFHPGGNIGQALLLVKDIMVSGSKIPKIKINSSIREASSKITKYKLGLAIVMKNNVVAGILTDGDARRSLRYNLKSQNIKKIMTSNPIFISENSSASKALGIMNKKKITSLLVVSDKDFNKKNKTLKGVIHIHNLLNYGIK